MVNDATIYTFDQIEIMEAETIHLIFTQVEKCCTRGHFMIELEQNQHSFSKRCFAPQIPTYMINLDQDHFGHSKP